MKKIVIIGGGASGLFAAAYLSFYTSYAITILEKNNRVGKKLLLTGNGKCNLANANTTSSCFNHIEAMDLFNQFDFKQTIHFFHQLGLMTKIDQEGRVYPYSESSTSVLDILRKYILSKNQTFICDFEVTSIIKNQNQFIVMNSLNEKIISDKLIIATGGKTYYKQTNSYQLATLFHHSITPLNPSLIGLKVKENVSSLQNLRVKASVSLVQNETILVKDSGEILFKKDGLSGIVIFQMSSYWNRLSNKNAILKIDFFPHLSLKELILLLKEKKCAFKELLDGILLKMVAQYVYKYVSSQSIEELAYVLKNLIFHIDSTYSFENAQVTSGGIDIKEIDLQTMMSKKEKDVYFIGEILDLDGICGGYNLQIAWTTAAICGNHLRKEEENEVKK